MQHHHLAKRPEIAHDDLNNRKVVSRRENVDAVREQCLRITALFVAVALMAKPASAGENWPEFRGPRGDGHSDATGLPLTWSETENITWKTAVHDRGWSSPVIWGRQIWLTTAAADGKQLFAVCVDRKTGKVLFDVKVFDVDKPQEIAKINSYASPTPVIEAKRVYAHYGTYGTACLDTETGKILWTRRDLNCDHHMGPGSSPILFGGLLIFNVDGTDTQYVVALDKITGQTVWKTRRSVDYSDVHPFLRKSFCTPTVVRAGERLQLISPGAKAVMAYDPNTGEELWRVRYVGWSIVPRPLFGRGLFFVITHYVRPELWALKPDGHGDVTDSHVVWKVRESMPAIPSLLLIGGLLYTVNNDGVVVCMEAGSGKIVWRKRLGNNYSASPVYADGRIYLFSNEAITTVIKPGRQWKVLAVNKLDGTCRASPAVAGKALFVRTQTHLYRIAE